MHWFCSFCDNAPQKHKEGNLPNQENSQNTTQAELKKTHKTALPYPPNYILYTPI